MFAPHRCRRCPSRRPGPGRALFLVAAFTVMLFATVAGNVATANQVEAQPATQHDVTQDIPADTPTEEPFAAPTEAPQDLPAPTGEPAEPFSIVIDKWACDDPATAPHGSTTYADYLAACTTPMTATFAASDGAGYADTQTGSLVSFAAPATSLTVIEAVPAGYGQPAVFCGETENVQPGKTYMGGSLQVQGVSGVRFHCDWFNLPMPDEDTTPSDLIVYKWACPAGYDETLPTADPILDCDQPQDGVTFTLDHPDPQEVDYQSMTGDSIPGAVMFGGIEPGPYTIVETLPPGWDHGFLWECTDSQDNFLVSMASGESHTIDVPAGEEIHCKWFNVPIEPEDVHYADLTIYKYTCPAGYDVQAPGADPVVDCPETTDGIDFTLTGGDPNTADRMATTGNPSTGMAYFGDLPIGDYTVTESVPADIDEVFILDCVGLMDGVQRPVPLSVGASFAFEVTGYEGHITCHWYNVPEGRLGHLTVIKYACWTEHFVSALDCEIYEQGVTFDLLWSDGQDWYDGLTATTDGTGRISWTTETGWYWLDELGGAWCHIASNRMDQDGEGFLVEAGEETVVEVYNCGYDQTWETPTKYPNTGVGPTEGAGSGPSTILPAFTPLAALMTLVMSRVAPPRVARRQATATLDAPVSWHDGAYRYPIVAPMTNALRRGLW